jgi:hypothetical protein
MANACASRGAISAGPSEQRQGQDGHVADTTMEDCTRPPPAPQAAAKARSQRPGTLEVQKMFG